MKRLILTSTIIAALGPAEVYAELSSLEDSAMSQVTGQAGLTIDLKTEMEIAEIAYQDQGYFLIQDFSLGGMGGGMLDDLRITVDIAGQDELLDYGFSRLAGTPKKQFNDGDLVVHIDSMSGTPSTGPSFTDVDFQLKIGSIAATDSGYTVGSMAHGGTEHFSDIDIQGYLGPIDMVIRNADGTHEAINAGMTASNQRMEVEAHFEVTDMSFDWDVGDFLIIFNFANLKVHDMKIHNRRGNDTDGHFGMASIKANFGEATNLSNGVTGLGIYDLELRTDIDILDSQFGDAPTIGQIYFTDFVVTADVVVYGH